ncbi:MAG: hypothetical protein ABJM29_06485 [Rhizobiaceae bacterium]
MRKTFVTLLGTTSVFALVVGTSSIATAADPQLQAPDRVLSGSMAIFGSYTTGVCHESECHGANSDPDDWFSLGGFGNVAVPVADNLSLQLGFYGEAGNIIGEDSNFSSSQEYANGVMGSAHLNFREPEAYLFGAFGALGSVETASDQSSGTANIYLAGVEGQYHIDDWTLYGQVAFADSSDLDNSDSDWIQNGVYLRGAVKHFFNDGMTKLQGDVVYVGGEQSTGDDIDAWQFGVEVEHIVSSYSNGYISAFGRFDAFFANESPDVNDDAEAYVFKIGLKASFGYDNLYQRDHYGEGVDIADIMRIQAVARATD